MTQGKHTAFNGTLATFRPPKATRFSIFPPIKTAKNLPFPEANEGGGSRAAGPPPFAIRQICQLT